MDRLDYDFSELEKASDSTTQVFGALECAMRQNGLAWEVRDYLKDYPKAAVVNLGCGLDQTGRTCDNGTCLICNIDLPDVIKVRDELLPPGDREQNIPADLNDLRWLDRIDGSNGAVFFAAGVFYYFRKSEVKWLLAAMAELGGWSPRLKVSSRGYMLGYFPLDDPNVRPVHRLLARLGDGPMKMQIVRVDFQ